MVDKIITRCINDFKILQKTHAGAIPYSLTFGSGIPHLLITSCIHGDETGSLPAVTKMAQVLSRKEIRFEGTISIALGNPEAIKHNQRFIEEDLNRVFTNNIGQKTLEQKRGQELISLLNQVDYHIDFHQTSSPNVGAFYITPLAERSIDFAQAVSATDKLVIMDNSPSSIVQTASALNYVTEKGGIGFTLELSQMGISSQAQEIAQDCMEKSINLLSKGTHSIMETALAKKKLHRFKPFYKEVYKDPQDQLKKGLVNLSWIKKDEIVGQRASGEKIKIKKSGFMLFPRYEKKPSLQARKEGLFLLLN